jgi:carboxypeptidase PM20D1
MSLGAVALVVAVIVAALAADAARFTSVQPEAGPLPGALAIALDGPAVVARLSEAVRIPTVTSDEEANSAPEAFRAFHAFLDASYPLVAQHLTAESPDGLSRLYVWTGRDPALPPVILTAHQDVVPAGDTTAWSAPPFAGDIRDGAVWGRGTLDDKSGLLAWLEAAEALLAQGFTPQRTIYFGFGHDEEGGGPTNGADAIAAALAARGVRDATVVDEGGWIYDGVPGVRSHVALVGIAEKGFLSVELRVRSAGGHSSMPPNDTAISVLANAVARVTAAQMPARFDGASAALFDTLTPEMTWPMKLLFANRWLTRPLILRELLAQPTTAATVRTTTAATIFRAGDKDNVLPASASAVINFRLLPGDTPDAVLAHVRAAVDDARVEVAPYHETGLEASAVSAITGDAGTDYRRLARAIRAAFPDVLVAPYLTLGATDGRRYQPVAANVYRFLAIDQPGATALLHAPNEHITIQAYLKLVEASGAIIQALGASIG